MEETKACDAVIQQKGGKILLDYSIEINLLKKAQNRGLISQAEYQRILNRIANRYRLKAISNSKSHYHSVE